MKHITPHLHRRSVLAVLALTASSALTPSAHAQAPPTYKFGLAMPLSGSQALYGSDQVKAAQWAVDAINAKGGVNGKKLEMITLDTQADPQVGINAANRLTSVEKGTGVHHGVVVGGAGGGADRPRLQDRGAVDRRQLARHRQAR